MVKASDIFKDPDERQEIREWLDLTKGFITLVVDNKVVVYENKKYIKKFWTGREM